MSACMIGLAVGQLFWGPISDRVGRRRPLIIGVAAFALLSLVCAFSPNIGMLIAARFLQGLAGSAGLVISRAVVRDVYGAIESARIFSLLAAIMGVAPVVAPLAGGALLLITDWRGVFVALAVVGAVIVVLTLLAVPESLREEDRDSGAIREQLIEIRRTAGNGTLLAYALAMGLGSTSLFAYISMSSIVFKAEYGVSAQLFSVIFAVNSIGIILGSRINSRLIRRFRLLALAIAAVMIGGLAALSLLGSAALGLPLFVLLIPLFVAIVTQGFVPPNVSALALARFSRGAGTAAAILGTLQFLLGAVIPPVVSLGGASTVLMAATMSGALLSALAILIVLRIRNGPGLGPVRPSRSADDARTSSGPPADDAALA